MYDKLQLVARQTEVCRTFMTLAYKQFSRRHLPHVHPPSSTLFVTYRLAGSIPQPLLRYYKTKNAWLQKELSRLRKSAMYDKLQLVASLEQIDHFHREWFVKFEETLDQARNGPT